MNTMKISFKQFTKFAYFHQESSDFKPKVSFQLEI